MSLLESVPNFSEGRDAETLDEIGAALGSHVHVADVHTDRDHNRSVFTVLGGEASLVEGLVAAVAVARERIDLRRHEGAHPRIGAADVVPIVPLKAGDRDAAATVAREVGERIGALGLPVFLYAPPHRGPAFYRRGGIEELQRRIDAGELAPDHGPAKLDLAAGGVMVGVRDPLIALNVDLTASLEAAKEIAAIVRETGGGFVGVRALGLELPSRGLVQVSMNIEDWHAAAPADVVARIAEEAQARGAEVIGPELVGLIPEAAAEGLPFGPERFLETHLQEIAR